jgi:plastocyanin
MATSRLSQAALAFIGLLFFFAVGENATTLAQESPYAEIHGKVTISRKAEPEHRHEPMLDRYRGLGGRGISAAGMAQAVTDVGLSERVVVYLEGEQLSRGNYTPPEKRPVLDQKNLRFHPQVLPILAGTTVDFPNRDNLFHNVFSYSQTKEFDLGRYPKDDSRSVRFDRPGVVRVYCDIHSQMNATIMVLSHPFFATPNDEGSYVIRGIPEGNYSIVLWVDRDVAERRSIEVRAGGTYALDFTY